jgi:regulatory protein
VRALRLLTARARGRTELGRALETRGFQRAAVDEALSRLAREGWLDDLAAARSAVRSRASRYGRDRIRRELAARGFSGETIEQAFGQVGRGEEKQALAVIQRRLWKLHARLPYEKRRRRVWTALLRRGFAAEDVSEIMKGSDEVDGSSGEIP